MRTILLTDSSGKKGLFFQFSCADISTLTFFLQAFHIASVQQKSPWSQSFLCIFSCCSTFFFWWFTQRFPFATNWSLFPFVVKISNMLVSVLLASVKTNIRSTSESFRPLRSSNSLTSTLSSSLLSGSFSIIALPFFHEHPNCFLVPPSPLATAFHPSTNVNTAVVWAASSFFWYSEALLLAPLHSSSLPSLSGAAPIALCSQLSAPFLRAKIRHLFLFFFFLFFLSFFFLRARKSVSQSVSQLHVLQQTGLTTSGGRPS